MKILLLYDCPAHQSGLSILGEWVHKGLDSLGHEIVPHSLFDPQGAFNLLKASKYDLCLGIGYWSDAQREIELPKSLGVKTAVYWVSEGAIPKFLDLIPKCDLLLATSEFSKGIFEKFVPGLEGKVKVAYPGTDTEFYKPKPELKPSRIFSTFVSSGNVKGCEDGISASKILSEEIKDFKYIIHMPFTEYPLEREYYIKLHKIMEAMELQKNVSLVAGIKFPRETMPKVYQTMAAFLAPWHQACFGFPIIEAGACGVPTVGGNWQPINEIIKDGETGLLFTGEQKPYTKFLEGVTFDEIWNYGDPYDMAEKMKKILDNPDERNRLGENARKYVVENFESKKRIKALEEELLKV